MLSTRFGEFRRLVDEHGATVVGEKAGYQKSAISRVYHGKYDANPERVIDAALRAFGALDGPDAACPEGYMSDAQGRLVPVNLVGEIDKKRDVLVRKTMQEAVVAAVKMTKLRIRILEEIDRFCGVSAEQYDKDLGGVKGNVQLTSFDGRYRIKRCVDDMLEFDERLQVAKEMIDRCLREWSSDSRPEIRTLIGDAFQVDKTGRVNTKRILSLRRLDIRDETWQRAMQAISDSVNVVNSRTYLRFYEKDASGRYQQVPVGI